MKGEIEQDIKTERVVSYRQSVYCFDCDVDMVIGEIVYMTDPPIYSYKCPECNKIVEKRLVFPRIIYKIEE